MKNFIKIFIVLLLGLFSTEVFAQTGQLQAGQVWGNPTASKGLATGTANPVLGTAGSVVGSLGLRNATSGVVTLTPATGALGSAIATLPAGTYNVVGDTLTQTLTNKTLTSPYASVINGGSATGSSLTLQSTSNGSPSGDQTNLYGSTVTIGAGTNGAGIASVVNLGAINSTSGGITVNIANANSGLSALNVYNAAGVKQTWVPGGGNTTVSFPTTTDTLVGRATTDTLTNKTFDTAGTGNVFKINGTQISSLATSANLEAGTANIPLTSSVIYDGEVTITFAASQTLDFSTFLNARITATANTTSLTCSNIKASQSGVITWVQDGTGSRTMVAGWCSQFRWAAGARGVLSIAASAVDALFYQCISTSICYVSLSKAEAN